MIKFDPLLTFIKLPILQKLITLLFAALFVCCGYSQKVAVAERPSWVDFQEYQQKPKVDENEISQGALTLLADYQVNIFQQEVYFRIVNKITDNVGVQSSSNINAVYDPLYQKLVFHSIKIIRDGKEIDKLVPEYFQVIKRELNAENYLYDGTLSAMLNLSDVRNGDIIDYSYTVKGFNPIHQGKFADSFNLNDYVPVGKVNVSINTKNDLNYKSYNSSLKPKISKRDGYKNYNWAVETPEPFEYEDNIPTWKIAMPTLVVSDYFSWEAVVDWATDIYGSNQPLNTALKEKVKEISKSHKTQGERIKATLTFVQNDIRYLGLEHGIGSYQPHSPNEVFEQRYGDCKDKSLLVVEMLKAMDVEAYPMLISTSLKNTILELPPSPSFFDHCVVKVVDKDKRSMYYDPTISNQGGTYKNTHFPNYEYGLVVKKNNTAFDTITSSSNNLVTTLEEYVIKEVNGGATLNVTSTYTDVEADQMRDYFKNNSISSISKEYENYYANQHSRIKIINKPSFKDDKEKNTFIVTESYAVDSIWQPMPEKPGYISIDFVPNSIVEVLYIPNMENRVHEMSLPYPVAREHRTTVILPSTWLVEKDNDIVSNDIFYYDFNVDYDKSNNQVQLKSYLKIQKPSVTPDEFKIYQNALADLEKSFGYSIFIPANSESIQSQSQSSFFNFGIVIYYILLLGGLIYLVIWITRKKKKTVR